MNILKPQKPVETLVREGASIVTEMVLSTVRWGFVDLMEIYFRTDVCQLRYTLRK